jgi:small subunit ribosomal protein S9
MTDEPQTPENEETPADEAAALAEHRAVPTEDAAEIAGSTEDAALEAFEEAQSAAAQAEPAAEAPPVEASATDAPAAAEAPVVSEAAAAQPTTAEAAAEEPAPGAPGVAETVASEPVAEESATPPPEAEVAAGAGESDAEDEDFEDDEEEPAPRVKPAVPGAHLEVDIVPEGVDPLGRDVVEDPYAIEDDAPQGESEDEDKALPEPISTAAIDLAAGARYRATGKRKTAIARVILRPGSGSYTINGRPLDAYFPRATLQRNIRQPLETVGYEERMDVVARLHGGGVSAQAGALRHGISRALLEADPNLRGELKRRGFLTRDSRAKERKKAGLKKARKRPQFSKR